LIHQRGVKFLLHRSGRLQESLWVIRCYQWREQESIQDRHQSVCQQLAHLFLVLRHWKAKKYSLHCHWEIQQVPQLVHQYCQSREQGSLRDLQWVFQELEN
jgi:hypothetical protein